MLHFEFSDQGFSSHREIQVADLELLDEAATLGPGSPGTGVHGVLHRSLMFDHTALVMLS